MRVPFRERNPLPLGLAGLATIAVLVLLVTQLNNLPFISGGTTYHAAFAEAAGLRNGEEVRIAGVKVGQVTDLGLEGDHVKVTFKIDDGVRVGDLSRAEIKIKTLLRAHYLSLVPRGPGRQNPRAEIPISRTATPFRVVPANNPLIKQAGRFATVQRANSLYPPRDTFQHHP